MIIYKAAKRHHLPDDRWFSSHQDVHWPDDTVTQKNFTSESLNRSSFCTEYRFRRFPPALSEIEAQFLDRCTPKLRKTLNYVGADPIVSSVNTAARMLRR